MRGSLRELIGLLRESLGSGSFMGGGASYPGPEPGKMFSTLTKFATRDKPPDEDPTTRRAGMEREEDPKLRRQMLKFLGPRKKKESDDGEGRSDGGNSSSRS